MNADIVWTLVIKGSAVLLVAFLVSLTLRKASASSRHIVWLAALSALLLIPLAELRLPAWNVPSQNAPILTPLVTPLAIRPIDQAPGPRPAFGISPKFEPHRPAPETPSFDYNALLRAAWIFGASIMAAWTAFGLLMVAILVRKSGRSDLAEEIGAATAPGVKIRVSSKLRVPATAGVLQPVILLPADALFWDRNRLQMVLAHEAAHVRRRDWLWQLLGQAACAVHFFNPLAWIGLRELRKESEIACDDFVLGLGIEPTSYASALLDIARSARFQAASTVGMARSSRVEGRLNCIVAGGKDRKWLSGRTGLGVLAATFALVLPIALVRAIPALVGKPKTMLIGEKRQGKPLPQIPWVRSKEVEPNVYLAQNGIAGLPGGFRVRLIGVSTDKINADVWDLNEKRRPDGEYWRSGGINWQGRVFHRGYHPSDLVPFTRSFFFEVESEQDAMPSITTDLVSPAPVNDMQRRNRELAGGDDKIPEVPLVDHDPSFAIIRLGIPAKVDKGVIRMGIANGEWTTVTDIKNPFSVSADEIATHGRGIPADIDQTSLNLGEKPSIWYMGVHGGSHNLDLVQDGSTLSPAIARRVLLFDRSGKPIELGDSSYTTDGFPGYTIPVAKFAAIGRVVLQTCPYSWAEFRDVPLVPDVEKLDAMRLDPGVRGTAVGVAPGFTKKLPNGVTVSLASVTKAVLDGDTWKMDGQPSWRADGQVLAHGPDQSGFSAFPINPWGKNPIYHFEFQYSGGDSDLFTYTREAGPFDPKFWLANSLPMMMPTRSSLNTAFLPGSKTGAARVAVASGPWETVSSRKIDMPELPRATSSDMGKEEDRTGFEVVLGDKCYFVTKPDENKEPMASKPVEKYAMRVVAKLKDGNVVPLREGLSGNRTSIFPVPARHNEWTEGYSHLIAAQIDEIEIQTRPYEWVEFNNIPLEHK